MQGVAAAQAAGGAPGLRLLDLRRCGFTAAEARNIEAAWGASVSAPDAELLLA